MALKVLNPVLRRVLRSPLGKRIGKLATIEVVGRRTGHSYSVVCGWDEIGGRPGVFQPAGHSYAVVCGCREIGGRRVVFTPAGWRSNFAGGAPAVVCHKGRIQQYVGEL